MAQRNEGSQIHISFDTWRIRPGRMVRFRKKIDTVNRMMVFEIENKSENYSCSNSSSVYLYSYSVVNYSSAHEYKCQYIYMWWVGCMLQGTVHHCLVQNTETFEDNPLMVRIKRNNHATRTLHSKKAKNRGTYSSCIGIWGALSGDFSWAFLNSV